MQLQPEFLGLQTMTIAQLIIAAVVGLCIVKATSFLFDYVRKWFIFNKIPGPGRRPLPFLGHAMLLTGDPDEFYEKILKLVMESPYRDTGAEVGFIWLGVVPLVNIFGPRSAETLLKSSKHIEKSFVYKFLHPWLGTGLLTSTGEKWKDRRRLLTPTFHFSILNDFLYVMNEQASIFTKNLEKYADSDIEFDITKPITLCALDIICETAMGKPINAQGNMDSEYVRALYRVSELIQARQKSPWLWWDFAFQFTKRGKEFEKCLNILHGFTKSVIEDRKKERAIAESPAKYRRPAFLDLLLDVSEGVLSVDDIREEVDTFMFEGHDTTAAALSWAIHLIATHSDVQRKIHEELDEHLKKDTDEHIASEDLKKLQYLEMVTKECLRMFPSVPIIGRVTSTDCKIDGHLIPAGTNCLLFLQIINMNPDYWEDPMTFRPERFSMKNSEHRHPYAYLPFSAGSRNCIGQKFAIMEEKVILAQLLRKYSLEACQKTTELRLMSDLILRPRDGIRVKLKTRASPYNRQKTL